MVYVDEEEEDATSLKHIEEVPKAGYEQHETLK